MEGVIEIRKSKRGKFYHRVRHSNGHILCHGSGKDTLEDCVQDGLDMIENGLVKGLLKIRENKIGEPYFRIEWPVSNRIHAWSESYSSMAKARQGADAVLRIFRLYADNQTPFELVQ